MEENKNIEPEQQLQNIAEEINSTTENILPEAETPATEQPETSNIKTETPKQMEVHHHTHPGHHKKKWTDYFWEFLMLFLAVFCGFLAEYQLEHKIEKEKGIQYIRSFVEDLKHDTASLTAMTKEYKRKVVKLNVISLCYDSLFAKKTCSSCLSELFAEGQAFWQLDVSDRTLQQLKNAGGLRLLSTADADSVTSYDNFIKGYKIDETTVFQETQTSLRSTMNELFHYSAIRKLNDKSYATNESLFVTSDKEIITKYFNTLARYNGYCTGYIIKQEKIRSKAIGLINYFTKKYHLK